jgi:hypothetical protein
MTCGLTSYQDNRHYSAMLCMARVGDRWRRQPVRLQKFAVEGTPPRGPKSRRASVSPLPFGTKSALINGERSN